jgi:hypothetical protein
MFLWTMYKNMDIIGGPPLEFRGLFMRTEQEHIVE